MTQAALFAQENVDTTQIVNGLERLFTKDGHRIVFWHDANKEFAEVISAISLTSVTTIRLDETPALAVKITLERTDPTGKYLLYMPFEEPDTDHDWLLDTRMYAGKFHADRASMLLDDLGLGQQQSLRLHLNKRLKFLNSKDRVSRLAKIVSSGDDEAAIDRKMIALLVKADQPEPFSIVTGLFNDLAAQGHGLRGIAACWEEVVKFDVAGPFWDMIAQTFGYEEDDPRLRNLLLRLLITDFAHNLDGELPTSLTPHQLPDPHVSNVVVCLNQWRDSAAKGNSYDILSADVADAIKLPDLLSDLSAESLLEVQTFLDVEKRIAVDLRDRIIQEGATVKSDEISAIGTRRQDGHWASASLPSTKEAPRNAFHAVYQALHSASLFADLLRTHGIGFPNSSTRKLYDSYASELYRFDQCYRHFCEAAAQATAAGWDLLKSLQDKMEADYGNGFLTPLSLAWGTCIERDLLSNWQIEKIDSQIYNQYRFYERYVKTTFKDGDNQRAFVVISDAFRYEAAHELLSDLNGKYRFKAELTSQLSVLPSYTALGMAAMLPHNTLSYNATGDVLVDNKSTSGLDNRSKILESVGGIAIGSDTLLKMKREEGRAFVKGRRVVYIYHDTVDAVGDKAATEDDTFQAARRAIEELGNLVRYIINSLNGTNVIITADHGFLFQQEPPDLTDKSKLVDEPTNTVVKKKRYLLGLGLPVADNVYHGKTKVTAHADGDMEFWIPKGTNRFHFTGGAKFIHGGAMLQEVMVPIITVRELGKEAAETTKTRSVAVHILGSRLKVTTNRHRFKLIQTEAVTQRLKPSTLQVGLYDGNTPVSNVETVTFDSSSGDMDDRTKTVSLSLKTQKYDKTKTYSLILRNAEDNIEVQRADVTIDLAISNDF